MTEESTPEITTQDDTSASVETTDNAVNETNTAPETTQTEPEAGVDTADEPGKAPEEPKLLAGKFKSAEELVKAYKEAEKFVTKSNELEKKLKAYQEAETRAREQREIEARRQGFNDVEEQRIDLEIRDHEFRRYVQAMETTLTGDNYNKALQALSKYQSTLNPKDLQEAQRYFTPAVIAEISRDTAIFENGKRAEYSQNMKIRKYNEVRANLENFAKETNDWLNPKERQDIVGLAVNLTGGDVDLNQVKGLIDAVEKAAVDRYIAEQKAAAENKAVQNSLTTPSADGVPANGEQWLTKEQYNNMTQEQADKAYDKIVRQIQLENEGKPPRMLTR